MRSLSVRSEYLLGNGLTPVPAGMAVTVTIGIGWVFYKILGPFGPFILAGLVFLALDFFGIYSEVDEYDVKKRKFF